MIVKKFLQVNYDQCEEVEAELSDYTIEGYRGFADIKIYALKDWYIDKLKSIHKRYLKISVGTTLASRGEEAMFRFLDQILKYGAYGVLGLLVLYELASMECVISAIALSASLFGSVKAIFESIPDLAVARTAESRIAPWMTYGQCGRECPSDFELTVRNVCYSVTDSGNMKNILHDADLILNKEEIAVITGKNGSGKSTLIKLMLGILKPDAGNILLNGENIEKFRDISGALLYLPQDDAELSLTADELFSLLSSERYNTALEILKDFGVTDDIIKTTPINILSGGERKKVFLSYALSSGAGSIILDEPTNMLDDGSRNILSEHLLARKTKGMGALIITHDAKLMSLADKIYHIEKGAVEIEKQ